MSFNAKRIDMLNIDPRLMDAKGKPVFAAIQGRAWKIDRGLIKLLVSDQGVKTAFLEEDGALNWQFYAEEQ